MELVVPREDLSLNDIILVPYNNLVFRVLGSTGFSRELQLLFGVGGVGAVGPVGGVGATGFSGTSTTFGVGGVGAVGPVGGVGSCGFTRELQLPLELVALVPLALWRCWWC